MATVIKLTPVVRQLLERVQRQSGNLLWLQVASTRERSLNRLIAAGYVEICDHPTVRVQDGSPAAALVITQAGKDALGC